MSDIVTKYERFDSNGLELVVDTASGKAYASQSATARMLKTNKGSLSRELSKGVADYDVINAKIETEGGLQGVAIYSADVVFKLAFKYNPGLAMQMGSAGANIYMLGLAGYKVAVEEPKPKTALELAKEQAKMALEQVRLHEQLESQAMQIKLKDAHIEILEEETDRQAEIIDELFDYSSIIRIAKYNGCDEKAFNWRNLKTASVVLNLEIKQAPCPRFVTKNLYHHDAWRLAYPGYRTPETTTLVITEIPESTENNAQS